MDMWADRQPGTTREFESATARQIEQALRATRRAMIQTIHAVSTVAGPRERYTALHQSLTATLSLAIGRELGLEDSKLEGVYLGALVHDIGKISIPSELLAKPSKLTPEEYSLIKTHVMSGVKIFEGVSLPWPVQSIIRQHHERLDGSGYPDGVAGDAIILEARIGAVADVFEAITSHRPYRPAREANAALWELEQGAGRKFDTAAVEALSRIVDGTGSDPSSFWSKIESGIDFGSTVRVPRSVDQNASK